MKFIYRWKNAKNERYTGDIDAPSRDAAFEMLRAQGIRAISVVPADNDALKTRRHIWRMVFLSFLCCVIGAAVSWILTSMNFEKSIGDDKRNSETTHDTRYLALVRNAENIRREHRKALTRIRLDWARNYAMIEHTKDIGFVITELERGQAVVRYARLRVADVFKGILEIFPESNTGERISAQRLYGELMSELDLDEFNISCAEMAVSLLAENRNKWHEVKGKVVWTDETLKREFDRYATDSDASTARWHRDFVTIVPSETSKPSSGTHNLNQSSSHKSP